MFDTTKPFTFDRVVRLSITAAVVYAMLRLMGFLSDVLIPFFLATLLAYLISPLSEFLCKKLKFRLLGVITSLLIVLAILTGLSFLIFPMIGKEINHMIILVSNLLEDNDFAQQMQERLPEKIDAIISSVFSSEKVKEYFSGDNLWFAIKELSTRILPGIWGIISGTTAILSGLLGIVIILLYLFFILLHYENITEGWKKLIPEKYKGFIIEFVSDFEFVMQRYFRNQAIIAAIMAFLFAMGFWIIDLPMGIIIGLFIGALNMVPYLQAIGILPCFFAISLYTLETGNSFWIMTGLVVLIFIIAQLIQDLILVPLIMGKFTGFNPAIIILSITIWGKLLGLLGFIIALPMTYLLLTYYRKYILGINRDKNKEGEFISENANIST